MEMGERLLPRLNFRFEKGGFLWLKVKKTWKDYILGMLENVKARYIIPEEAKIGVKLVLKDGSKYFFPLGLQA